MVIDRGNFHNNISFLVQTGLLTKSKRILEIGSGMGHLLQYLSFKGYKIIGTEINDSYINYARKQYNLKIQKMDGDKINFPDNYFDIVLSFDVLEHIPDPGKHLDEVNRVLKPDGYYLFQTPNKLTNIPFEIIKEKSLTRYKSYHCSLQTIWSLKELLKRRRFKTTIIFMPVVNKYFIDKIKKYLGSTGILLIKLFNPDRFPSFLKTNFYVIARNENK